MEFDWEAYRKEHGIYNYSEGYEDMKQFFPELVLYDYQRVRHLMIHSHDEEGFNLPLFEKLYHYQEERWCLGYIEFNDDDYFQ